MKLSAPRRYQLLWDEQIISCSLRCSLLYICSGKLTELKEVNFALKIYTGECFGLFSLYSYEDRAFSCTISLLELY